MNWFDWLKIRKPTQPFEERHDIAGTPILSSGNGSQWEGIGSDPYTVYLGVEDFNGNISARTYAKDDKLYCSMDLDMESPPWDAGKILQKNNQRDAVALHEFMHCALWQRKDITHSPDPKDILYYYVDGSNRTPSTWDISVMTDAAQRIGRIRLVIKYNPTTYPKTDSAFRGAVVTWNAWLGREFFKIIDP